MLRLILATTLLAVCAQAGVLNDHSARDKRSPQMGGNNNNGGNRGSASDMTKPFTTWAAKDSDKINQVTAENWKDKASVGREVEAAGDRTEKMGQVNAVKIEQSNQKSVIKALDDVDKAQDGMGAMLSGDQGGNNNRGNNN